VSGASTGSEGTAWLEEDAAGQARVLRLGTSSIPSTVFELDLHPSGDLAPANVDALAVGPRGELGILSLPSGREPASSLDPAVVILPGAPAMSLAPWSTLTPAGDPACRADPSGWRATVQTLGPWLRLAGTGDLHGTDEATMLARVRWGTARVCLEAVEVRAQDMTLSAGPGSQGSTPFDQPVEAWVVARFAGAIAAGRVVVVSGGELHQSLDCKLGAP
jgi:hypothetical protein